MLFRLNLFSLFIIMILVEIFLFAYVGEMIGGFQTVLCVVITGFFGMYILHNPTIVSIQKMAEQIKREQEFNINPAQKPIVLSEPIVESFLVLGGGLLLIMPGFLTDFIGLIAYFPWSRLFLVRRLSKYFVAPSTAANDPFIEAKYRHEDE